MSMASRYPAAWMEELRARNDIVQVISGYVGLKKSGRKYWGLCPFHGEKTASFSVDEERQLFYCFGCKASGDVISFLMEMDHLTFQEAVETLAERAHLPMPEMEDDPDYIRRRSQRERLLEANRQAAVYYHEMLFRTEGLPSLRYLKERGLDNAVIRKFGLGAAPDQWDALTKHLLAQGFTLEELSLAGLTVVKPAKNGESSPRAFDMFRNRAVFPIIDMNRNVLAFGGRSLGKQEPKYLNTSDTPVFNKRRGVYAANLLRQQRHLDQVILVEGYMDVVALTQYGIPGVCATLGTAFTNEQARLLKRFAPEVHLAYDGDSAGQHAILRGLDILEQEGIPVRVLDFPDGLDPDEFIRRDGAEGFRKLPRLTPATYRLRRLRDQFDLSDPEKRVQFARKAAAVLEALDPVEREAHLNALTIETGFAREVLLEQMDVHHKSSGGSDRLGEPRNPVSRPPARRSASPPVSEETVAEEQLLGILASGQIPKDIVEEKDFGDEELKSLYVNLSSGVSVQDLVSYAPDESSRSRYTRILMAPPAKDTDELIAMAHECVNRIRKSKLKKELQQLVERAAQASGEEADAMMRKAQEISRQLSLYSGSGVSP